MKRKNSDGVNGTICPVCGKIFSDDTRKEKADPDYEPFIDRCRHCGWYYDPKQVENPDLRYSENEMSLNEYREWFKRKISKCPEYDYRTDFRSESAIHMCPVCGKYKFEWENSFCICPYCGWEDNALQNDDPDYVSESNRLSLNEYRKQYEKLVSENPRYKWLDQLRKK